MPYRDDRGALRERVAWLEGELERARAERDRIPELTRQLADARRELSGLPAKRSALRVHWVLALAAAVGAVALIQLVMLRRSRPAPEARSPVAAAARATKPRTEKPRADVLPTRALRGCLAQIPAAHDFYTISGFEDAEGELTATWHVAEKGVHLRFDTESIARTASLGAHAGWVYARDISFCQQTPLEGPCDAPPMAPLPGVVSELSVQVWEGYVGGTSVHWMLVTTESSLLLLQSAGRGGRLPDDRDLCAPDRWQRVLEIPIAPGLTIREDVLVGTPPATFDCRDSASSDARCAG